MPKRPSDSENTCIYYIVQEHIEENWVDVYATRCNDTARKKNS